MGLNGFHIDKYLAPRTIRQCCLAGSSKTAPRIFIFLIVLGAEYLSDVKSIATFVLTFFLVYYFSLSQCVPCSLKLASEHCNALAAFRFHSCLAAGHVARFFLEGFIWFSHQIKRKKRVKEPPSFALTA